MKKTYKLIDLDCANCAAKMERAIAELPEVKSVSVSFLKQKMSVELGKIALLLRHLEKALSAHWKKPVIGWT